MVFVVLEIIHRLSTFPVDLHIFPFIYFRLFRFTRFTFLPFCFRSYVVGIQRTPLEASNGASPQCPVATSFSIQPLQFWPFS